MRVAAAAPLLFSFAAVAQQPQDITLAKTDRLCAAIRQHETYIRTNDGSGVADQVEFNRKELARLLNEVVSRYPADERAAIAEQCKAGTIPADTTRFYYYSPQFTEPLPPSGYRDVTKVSTVDLCRDYKVRDKDATIRAELDRRKLFTPADWIDIDATRLYLGMPELKMVCSLGRFTDVNSSTGSWGTHRQYVYGNIGYYIYVENGKVTSWQN